MSTATKDTVGVTTAMAPELIRALKEHGWSDKAITGMAWGRRVMGDAEGVWLEKNGRRSYHAGPFTSVQAGGQVAICRQG